MPKWLRLGWAGLAHQLNWALEAVEQKALEFVHSALSGCMHKLSEFPHSYYWSSEQPGPMPLQPVPLFPSLINLSHHFQSTLGWSSLVVTGASRLEFNFSIHWPRIGIMNAMWAPKCCHVCHLLGPTLWEWFFFIDSLLTCPYIAAQRGEGRPNLGELHGAGQRHH